LACGLKAKVLVSFCIGAQRGNCLSVGPIFCLFCVTNSTDDFVENLFEQFEVFTAMTMKNGVFWDVTPCGSYKNRRFGGA
jgi:hypothetical protein